MKIVGDYSFYWGDLRGAKPPSQKMGFFKAEGLISGWAGKIRNNLYSRIIGQSINFKQFTFKISKL
jgi:hypothetical protein